MISTWGIVVDGAAEVEGIGGAKRVCLAWSNFYGKSSYIFLSLAIPISCALRSFSSIVVDEVNE